MGREGSEASRFIFGDLLEYVERGILQGGRYNLQRRDIKYHPGDNVLCEVPHLLSASDKVA